MASPRGHERRRTRPSTTGPLRLHACLLCCLATVQATRGYPTGDRHILPLQSHGIATGRSASRRREGRELLLLREAGATSRLRPSSSIDWLLALLRRPTTTPAHPDAGKAPPAVVLPACLPDVRAHATHLEQVSAARRSRPAGRQARRGPAPGPSGERPCALASAARDDRQREGGGGGGKRLSGGQVQHQAFPRRPACRRRQRPLRVVVRHVGAVGSAAGSSSSSRRGLRGPPSAARASRRARARARGMRRKRPRAGHRPPTTSPLFAPLPPLHPSRSSVSTSQTIDIRPTGS